MTVANNATGDNNIGLGNSAGANLSTGSNNLDIGNLGVARESSTIRVGTAGRQTQTFIAGISGATVAGGVGVIIDTNGQLGTVVSSERFKDAIKPMDKASEAILSLRPVSFRYRKELDAKGEAQFGLIAEEVAKVAPDLVVKDELGKPFSVRYDGVNAMLLNEFLKEHCKVEELETTVGQLKSTVAQQKDLQTTVAQLQSTLKEQAAQIQKVSDQLAASQTAPPMLVKNQ